VCFDILEISIVELEPVNGPGLATWLAWAVLGVLGLLLACSYTSI
jgi:hypothetical protein